jgi:uncharacterized protein (TIGR02118 family)
MTRMLVCYGTPEDPAEFDRYYREVHVPLAWTLPGLREYTVSTGEITGVGEEAPYLIASLTWDSTDEMNAALGSPDGAKVAADVENFATGGWWLWSYEETATTAGQAAAR